MRYWTTLLVALLAVVGLAACGSSEGDVTTTVEASSGPSDDDLAALERKLEREKEKRKELAEEREQEQREEQQEAQQQEEQAVQAAPAPAPEPQEPPNVVG